MCTIATPTTYIAVAKALSLLLRPVAVAIPTVSCQVVSTMRIAFIAQLLEWFWL